MRQRLVYNRERVAREEQKRDDDYMLLFVPLRVGAGAPRGLLRDLPLLAY